MLRAVRFAATFDFTIEPDTLAAIQAMAADVTTVSAERIGIELRRMLIDPNRAIALDLLRETNLLAAGAAGSRPPRRNRASAKPGASSPHCAEPTLAARPGRAALASRRLEHRPASSAAACVTPIGKSSARRGCSRTCPSSATRRNASGRGCSACSSTTAPPSSSRSTPRSPAPTIARLAFVRERLAWPAEQLNPPPLDRRLRPDPPRPRPQPRFRPAARSRPRRPTPRRNRNHARRDDARPANPRRGNRPAGP